MMRTKITAAAAAILALSISACSAPASGQDPSAASPTQGQTASATATFGPDDKKMPAVIHKSFTTGAAQLDRAGIKYEVLGADGQPYDVVANPPGWGVTIDKQSIPWGEPVPPGTIVQLTISLTDADQKALDGIKEAQASASASASAKAAEEKQAADAKAEADRRAAEERANAERVVSYVVEADGPIGVITYTNWVNNQMGQEQASDVYGPVTKEYRFRDSSFNYGMWSLGVSAQAGAGTSSVTCRILVNGREIAAQTSTGQYSVVSCNKGGY